MPITDFEAHNAEVRATWDAYRAGRPTRAPVIFGINPRFTMWMPEANPTHITFQRYFDDPDLMAQRQIEHAYWVCHHVPQDVEMGLPKNGWSVYVDFQNSYEALWFGCGLHFYDDQVPDTRPILTDDNKRVLFDRGLPDPFTSGWMPRNWDFYERLKRKQESGWTMYGLPIVSVSPTGGGTDGPMTVCCNLRGAAEFATDLLADPDYAHELLNYVTEGTIARLQAYRRHFGQPERTASWGFADDSIELLSLATYQEMVFPYHKRLVEAMAEPGARVGIHLCGNAQRHFAFLKESLNVLSFDTGYPFDFAEFRRELGPDVEVYGGPSVPLLRFGSPEGVRAEVTRVLESGIMEGGRFVLREGNNLAPGTPVENLEVMYETAKRVGRYG